MDPQPRKKRQAQDKKKSKGQIYSGKHVRLSLVTKGNTSHTLLNSKDVVVVNGVHSVK